MRAANVRWLSQLILALIIGTAAILHFFGDGASTDVTGLPLIFDHIFQLVTAMGLLWASAGAGFAILDRLGIQSSRPASMIAYATITGYGLLATVVLILGFLNLLSPLPIAGFLVLAILISYRYFIQIPSIIAQSIRWIADHAGHGAYRNFFLAVILITSIFLIMKGLAPPTDWDSLMYHLQIPNQFVQEGRIFVPVDNLHVSYVGLIHMLYIPALMLHAQAAPALINAVFAMLLSWAVFDACLQFFEEQSAWLSLPFFWANTVIVMVASTARIDVSHALILFLGHLATVHALRNTNRKRWFLLGGFLLGASVGVKLSGLAYAFGVVPLLAYYLFTQLHDRKVWLQTVAWLLAFVLGAIPWLAKNTFLLGTPLYPFLANRLVDPWMIPFLGTKFVPESAIDAFRNLFEARIKLNPIAAFVSPASISIEAEGVFYFLNPFLMTIPIVLLFLRDRKRVMLLLPPALYILSMYVIRPASSLRYYIPALPALTVLLANLLVKLNPQRPGASAYRWLLLAFTAISLIPTSTMIVWQMRSTHNAAYTIGTISRDDYLSHYPDDGFAEYMQVVKFIQDSLPDDSEILMLFDGRGLYINQSTIQDNMIANWPLLAPRISSGQDLRALGISHIFVNTGALQYYVQRGTDIDAVAWDAFSSFAETELHQVYESPTYSLYEINGEQ